MAILALIAPGTLAESTARDNVFELDDDWTLAALLFAAMLLGAATAAVAWARRRRPIDPGPLGFAAAMVVLAVDELTSLHQHVETAVGAPWELVYAPLAIAGAAFAVRSAQSLPGRFERRLMAAGGLLWLLAQGLDHRGFTGSEAVDDLLQGAEAVLEMLGALLFWLSFAYALECVEQRAPRQLTHRGPRARTGRT